MCLSCHKGNTPETINAAKLAKEKGAAVIILTWKEESEITPFGDYIINYTFGDNKDIAGEKIICIWHIMRMDWRMWFCQSIRRAFSIRKQMDLKDIIPVRQTAKRRKNRQRISFAETGASLEACRRQRQKFRSKN